MINSVGIFLGPTLTTRLVTSTPGEETSAIDAFVRVAHAPLTAERVRGGILTSCGHRARSRVPRVMVDAGMRATDRLRAAKVASIEKCGGPRCAAAEHNAQLLDQKDGLCQQG